MTTDEKSSLGPFGPDELKKVILQQVCNEKLDMLFFLNWKARKFYKQSIMIGSI